jgi:hypothetical protein
MAWFCGLMLQFLCEHLTFMQGFLRFVGEFLEVHL